MRARPRIVLGCILGALVATPGARAERARAPLVTTPDRAAEQAFHAAMESVESGDDAAAEERLRGFLLRFPNDALGPRARLELGRLLLARYDGEAEQPLVLADEALTRAIAEGDPSVAERARLYAAVIAFHRGRHRDVVTALRALRGRLVVEEDARLLLATLAAACDRLGDRVCAIEALDRRVAREDDEGARDPLDRELGEAIARLEPEEAATLYGSLPSDGPAWARVAVVLLRAAYARGELARAAEIARALRDARVTLEDADLRALALQVERAAQVAPHVVGVILPLSGPYAARGQSVLRGFSLGGGIPPTGPFGASSLQIVLRDHAGRPERAVAALEELFTLHRVAAVVAPPDDASARAVAARGRALGLPVIVLDGRAADEAAITLDVAHRDEVSALLEVARGLGARRTAIVRADDDRRAFLDDAVSDRVFVARLTADQATTRATLDAMLGASPDTLLVGLEARDVGAFLRELEVALRARRVRARPRLLFVSTAFSESLLGHARRALEGALVAQTESRGGDGFRARYAARYGESPDPLARLAFDASTGLSMALAGGTTDRRVVAERIRAAFAASASTHADVVVRRVARGRLVAMDAR